MAKTICLCVATNVFENKLVSYKFMFDSKMPKEFFEFADFFGVVILKEDPDFVDVFAIGHPEESTPEGPVKRWEINIFESGKGFVLAVGFNQDPNETELAKILAKDIPDCVLLVNADALEPIRKVCEAKEITLYVHEHQGILATS